MAARETRPMHEAGSPPHPNVGDGDVDWDDVVTVRAIAVTLLTPPPAQSVVELFDQVNAT